jgi:CheY-like chemotaxis protein
MSKIMIIDDDPRVRDVYQSTLSALDYDVVAEPDGEQALENIRVNKVKPDLILLDMMMPKIFGMDILDIIKTTPEASAIKIIVLSALSDKETIEKAKQFGAADFITKSETTMPEVIEKIKKVIAS